MEVRVLKENGILDEYYKQKKLLADLIREGKLEVEEINQFSRYKRDLSQMLAEFKVRTESLTKYEKKETNLVCLYHILGRSKSTYIAPAFNLNAYLDKLVEYNIKRFNKEINYTGDDLYVIQINITIQTLLISIKCLLDRIVPLLSYYYVEVRKLDWTFGRVKDGKSKDALMEVVLGLRDSDPLMRYLSEQYEEWIEDIVSPRDMIVHYNDLGVREHHTVDGRIIPVHLESRLYGIKDENSCLDLPRDFSYKDICHVVDKLYTLYEIVFLQLEGRPINHFTKHFTTKKQQ